MTLRDTRSWFRMRGLNMDTDAIKLIFWRRMAPKVRSMTNEDILKELKTKLKEKKNEKKVTTTQTV